MNDGKPIYLGNHLDLNIRHDGNNSIISHSGTGDLLINTADGEKIYVDTSEIVFRNAASNETLIKATQNGAVELYHDNTKMAYTSSSGFDVTNGDLRSHLDIKVLNDNQKLRIGAGNDLNLYHNGSHSYITNSTGALIIEAASSNEIQLNGNGQHAAKFNPTGTSYIYYNGNLRFAIGSANTVHYEDFVPSGDGTYDLGSSSYRWGNVWTTDLQLSNKGKVNDVDGTWGDYTIQEGENDLFLINNRSGKKYKFNLTEVS